MNIDNLKCPECGNIEDFTVSVNLNNPNNPNSVVRCESCKYTEFIDEFIKEFSKKKAFITTVQIAFQYKGAFNEDEACDWVSGLLTEHEEVLDWEYLKINNKFQSPKEFDYEFEDDDEEGGLFRKVDYYK